MSFVEELKRRNVFRVSVAYGITSWVILQVADIVFDNVPAPEWVMQAIMLTLVIGFMVTLVVAWVFEITPEGIKKEKDIDRSQSLSTSKRHTLNRAIIVILVIAVVLLLADKIFLTKVSPDRELADQTIPVAASVDQTPSVAILPFLNLSGIQENEYFSDGLTETLLHMLAQLPDLHVAARTSAFAFKGQNIDVREVASILGVAHVLEGSVQRAGKQVRVTAQLIRANDGFHVWSQNYDRTLDDIFAIQDEIASDVAKALGASLLPDQAAAVQSVATTDTAAYDDYLRALEKYAVFSYSSLGEGENLLKAALAKDPGFYEAKVALARNYQRQVATGLIEQESGNVKIQALVQQLLAERPQDPSARSLNLIQQGFEKRLNGDLTGLQELLPDVKALLTIAPNETLLRQFAAGILLAFDENEAAVKLFQEGLLIDPLDPDLHNGLAGVYLNLDRLEEAEQYLMKAQELNPDDPNIVGSLAGLSRQRDQVVEMLTWYRRSAKMDPQDHEIPGLIAEVLFQFKYFESGDYWASRTRALAPDSPAWRNLELKRAIAVGDNEQIKAVALKILDDEISDRNGVLTNAKSYYTQIMQQQGKSQQALEKIEAYYPGVSGYVQIEDDLPLIITKAILMPLHKELSSTEEFRQRYDEFVRIADEKGLPWRTDPDTLMLFSLLADDMETALSAALESLDEDNTLSDKWRRFANSPLSYPLLNEPEVISRLDHFESEERRLHIELKAMLMQPGWAL